MMIFLSLKQDTVILPTVVMTIKLFFFVIDALGKKDRKTSAYYDISSYG
jgi:hypothetical protein